MYHSIIYIILLHILYYYICCITICITLLYILYYLTTVDKIGLELSNLTLYTIMLRKTAKVPEPYR